MTKPFSTSIPQNRLFVRSITLASVILATIWLCKATDNLFSGTEKQADLRTYQTSIQIFEQGGNPYDERNIVRFSNDTSLLRYMYAPQTLPLISVLVPTHGSAVRYIYFSLEVLAIVALLWIWSRYFVPNRYAIPLLLLFVIYGFNGSTGTDIWAANINLFINVGLWLAFVAFLDRRYALFSILVFLIAIPKDVEILFLALLLLERNRKAYRWFGIILGAFIVQHVAGWVIYPDLYRAWIVNLQTNYEWGALNPASLPAIDGAFFKLCRLLGIKHVWGYSAMAIYAAYAMAVPVVTILLLKNFDREKFRVELLMLAIFAYAIILPRFKDYSYMLLILPAAWLVLNRIPGTIWKIVYIAAVVVPVFGYQPLVVAMGSFAYLLIDLRRSITARAQPAFR